MNIPELTKSAVEEHKQEVEVKNLHPADELDMLNAKIAKADPKDEKLPEMLERRRMLSKRCKLQRLMREIKELSDGDDDDRFIGPPVGSGVY